MNWNKKLVDKWDEQNQKDIAYSDFLSATCLSNINLAGITSKTISLNQKYLSDYLKTTLSKDLTVLFTAILENEMPTEEDDLSSMFDDVRQRQNKFIRKIAVSEIYSDFYYQNIIKLLPPNQIYEKKIGPIYFGFNSISKHNLFIVDEVFLDSHGREITPLAYFAEDYYYPYIADENTVWMSIIPHEINTMKESLKRARGRVLIYGLGLGYFPVMCAAKKDVQEITVVENDKNIIATFNKYILPCFKNAELKPIRIVEDDVFKIGKTITAEQYDYVFADIWHNETDGIKLYLALRKIEKKGIRYDYWIENTLLVYLKRILVTILSLGTEEKEYNKSVRSLEKKDRELCCLFKPYLDRYLQEKPDAIENLFSLDNLKDLLNN